MSPLRDSDLTPALRERLRAAGIDVRRRKPGLSRKGAGDGTTLVRCHACGETGTYSAVAAHVDEAHGGGRIDTVLEPDKPPE